MRSQVRGGLSPVPEEGEFTTRTGESPLHLKESPLQPRGKINRKVAQIPPGRVGVVKIFYRDD